MKKLLLSSLIAAGAFSVFSACSDDPVTASSPIAAPTSSDSGYPGTSSSSSAFAPIPGYSSAIVPGSSGSNPLSSSSAIAPVPGSSSSVVNPSLSSSSVNPTSSATPGSSAVESSSSAEPAKTTGNPEEDRTAFVQAMTNAVNLLMENTILLNEFRTMGLDLETILMDEREQAIRRWLQSGRSY